MAAEASNGLYGIGDGWRIAEQPLPRQRRFAAQLGLKCELILRGHEQELSGNYLLSRMLNAEITYVAKSTSGDEMNVHLADAESVGQHAVRRR